MAQPTQRIDLVPSGKLNSWKAQFPIGRIVQMFDVNGDEKPFLVKNVESDATPVFHPETNESLFRVIVTLVPQ